MKRTENKKTDLRVLKTQKLLCNSLFELLEEKSIDSLTVQEICEKAMINRMTFYKHYADKYDLFSDCIGRIQKEICDKVEKLAPLEESPARYCETLMKNVIDFCDKNRDLLKKFSLKENLIATNILYESLQSQMENFLTTLSEGKEVYIPIPYSAAFLTGGCVKMIVRWLSQGEDYSKKQLFADLEPFFKNYMRLDVLFKA